MRCGMRRKRSNRIRNIKLEMIDLIILTANATMSNTLVSTTYK